MAYRNKKNPTRTAYPNVDVILSLLTPLWHLDCLRSQVRKISQLLIKGRCNPTTNGGMQNGSSEVHIACTFVARLARICMLGRCSSAKFLHRSSVGSLLGVRCWLGIYVCQEKEQEQWQQQDLGRPDLCAHKNRHARKFVLPPPSSHCNFSDGVFSSSSSVCCSSVVS